MYMGDLTSSLESIVRILNHTVTGIGTSDYDIIDDDGNELNVENGNILVTYTMNKEELRDLFGSTQDYDIVIVCKTGETEDKFIGLNTKQWKEQVILEVNVIDKHSAVGSGNKYITGDLVRYKSINALRKFIEANTNNPSGTINRWKFVSVENSEDISTKPIIFKARIVTETLMFYSSTI